MEKQKQATQAGILFMILVLIHIGMQFIDFGDMPTWATLIISQAFIIVPVIVYFIVTKQNVIETMRLHKVNIWSFLLVIPLTYCMYPLLICVNAISMAFSTNVIASTMTDVISGTPYIAALSLMALMPAVVEETTFRGALLGGFHRDSNPWPGILVSALCFGFMHMNINQISYAFVLGLCMGITLEASGSILSTILIHFLYNGTSTTLLYLLPKLMQWSQTTLEQEGMSVEQMEQFFDAGEAVSNVTTEQMLLTAVMFLPVAAIGLVLAAGILYLIAKLNKRELRFLGMFKRKTPEQKAAMEADKVKLMTVFLWIGLGICLLFAIATEIIIRFRQ